MRSNQLTHTKIPENNQKTQKKKTTSKILKLINDKSREKLMRKPEYFFSKREYKNKRRKSEERNGEKIKNIGIDKLSVVNGHVDNRS